MVLVSDQIKERIPEVKHEHPDIFKMFDAEFLSCDLGMVKTDEGFFPTVLDKLELDPQEVIFIDDSGLNLQAARNAGIMNTIKFNSSALLEMALEAHGVVFERIVKPTEQKIATIAVAT